MANAPGIDLRVPRFVTVLGLGLRVPDDTIERLWLAVAPHARGARYVDGDEHVMPLRLPQNLMVNLAVPMFGNLAGVECRDRSLCLRVPRPFDERFATRYAAVIVRAEAHTACVDPILIELLGERVLVPVRKPAPPEVLLDAVLRAIRAR